MIYAIQYIYKFIRFSVEVCFSEPPIFTDMEVWFEYRHECIFDGYQGSYSTWLKK